MIIEGGVIEILMTGVKALNNIANELKTANRIAKENLEANLSLVELVEAANAIARDNLQRNIAQSERNNDPKAVAQFSVDVQKEASRLSGLVLR